MDRARERPVIIASAEGGVEIEEVAKTSPEKVIKEWVDPVHGLPTTVALFRYAATGIFASGKSTPGATM